MENPDLKATIFDLSESKQFASEIIERAGFKDRIKFKCGNFVTDDIDGDYDAA